MRVLYDTFTEASDTALGSHTPDERPGSEAWTVASGGLDVIASTDRVQANQQAGNAAGINWAMVGDFDIYGDVYMSDTGNVSFPSIRAFLSTSYDTAEGVYFQYQEDNAQFVLGYESTNDGESFDTFASATPASGTTMRMERTGNTLNGYVGGVLHCTLSLTGTDFAGGATLYPGLTCATFSADRPAWDNFEVTQPGYITVGTATATVTNYTLTVSTTPDITVGTATATVTTYALTIGTGTSVTVGTATATVTNYALTVSTVTYDYPLKINDTTTIRVRPGGHRAREVPLAEEVVHYVNGNVGSGITTYRGYMTTVSIETPELDQAEAATLYAALNVGTELTFNGWLVGGTLAGVVRRLRWIPGDEYRALAFDIVQSS